MNEDSVVIRPRGQEVPRRVSGDTLQERLKELALEVGGTHELFQFDAGLNARITVPGRGSVSVSFQEGEAFDPVERLRQKLVEDGIIDGPVEAVEQLRHSFTLTYADGTTRTVQAFDAEQAWKLAGRGRPEKIEES